MKQNDIVGSVFPLGFLISYRLFNNYNTCTVSPLTTPSYHGWHERTVHINQFTQPVGGRPAVEGCTAFKLNQPISSRVCAAILFFVRGGFSRLR